MKKITVIIFCLMTLYTQAQNTFPFPATGNVGIGTTAPSATLQVGGGSGNLHAGSEGILLKPSTGDRALMELHSPDGTNRLVLQSLSGASQLGSLDGKPLVLQPVVGNVGIGTLSPSEKLSISGGYLGINGPGLDGSIYQHALIGANATGGLIFEAPKNSLGKNLDIEFNWRGGGTPPLFVKGSTGNVGIGTTDPENSENWDRVLEITGNFHSKALVSSSNVKSGIWSHNVGYYDAPAGGITGTWSNHPFSIMTNRSARLTVSASGNVGIGTISPNSKLEIINTSTLTYPLIGTAYGALHIVPKAGSAANSSAAITFGAAELVNGSQAGIYVQSSGAYGTKMYFGTTNNYATGTQSRMMIDHNGNVGIGTTNPTQKLSVNGTIQAKEIIVNTGWSDFVFDNTYKLRPLTEVEQFVKTNKHLPEIPSQKEVEKNGVQLGDISSKLLMKIEELTLYIIEQNKKINNLENIIKKSNL